MEAVSDDVSMDKPLTELQVELEDRPASHELYTSGGRLVRFDNPPARVVRIAATPVAAEHPEASA